MRHVHSPVRLAACFGVMACCLILATGPAGATTISFDDLLGGGVEYAAIVSPYAGFTWSNFGALNTVLYTADVGPNGYANGVVSETNVGYAFYGDPASFSAAQGFTLNRYAIGAAWNDSMTITVQGWRNGAVVDTDNVTVSSTGSVQRQPDWTNIDTVTLSVAAAGSITGYSGLGSEFYLDNIQVNDPPIPEPGAFTLFIAATAVALALHHRVHGHRGFHPRATAVPHPPPADNA